MKGWYYVFKLGLLYKVGAKILAPIAVLMVDRKEHHIWGVRDTNDFSWWNTGVINGAHNMFNRFRPDIVHESANTADRHMESEGFQWRRRWSADGRYVSFRMTWGKPRDKGKKEFYIGWTMNEKPTMRLTFFQFRPF